MIDDNPLSDNFLRLISPDMFPYLKSLKDFLPVQDAKRGREFLPDKARGIWKRWLDLCYLLGIRTYVSEGLTEWVEDKWREMDAAGVYDLFVS